MRTRVWRASLQRWRSPSRHESYASLAFEDRLGLLVDREATERENRRLERNLKAAKLRANASIEDLDLHHPRGLCNICGLTPEQGSELFRPTRRNPNLQ
jgi:hypothetical protein